MTTLQDKPAQSILLPPLPPPLVHLPAVHCADGEWQQPLHDHREKIEDYLRFFTHAGETSFPIFARGTLAKLSHFRARMRLMLTFC